jgi:hypothetical protein
MQAASLAVNPEAKSCVLYDVGASIRSWGLRGIVWGGATGLALGAVLIAFPSNFDVLTFGVIGTLAVATVEGALVAGALCAFAALLYGKGAISAERAGFDRSRTDSRRSARASGREPWIPASDCAMRPSYPAPAAVNFTSQAAAAENAAKHTLQGARLWLTTIDAWEIGNNGP